MGVFYLSTQGTNCGKMEWYILYVKQYSDITGKPELYNWVVPSKNIYETVGKLYLTSPCKIYDIHYRKLLSGEGLFELNCEIREIL